jgi:hypothetical protein
MNRKLGKLPPRHDRRTLMLEKYLPQLPPFPETMDWGGIVTSWPMFLNDRLGDCAYAAPGHMIQAWTANVGSLFTPTDDQILAAYAAGSGYNPDDPSTDQGAVELDVLKYWRNTGIAGRIIGAYASIRPYNDSHVKAAIHLFGGLYIGVSLPVTAQDQDIWDVVPGDPPDARPGSWGGHAVNVTGYDLTGLDVVTWGAVKRMTWAFWGRYVDEVWGIISPDFLVGGQSPDGFALEQLNEDLKAITQ